MWWINCAQRYYSAIENKKILLFVIACMNMENIIQSEVSQTKKAYTALTLNMWILKLLNFYHWSYCGLTDKGNGEILVNSTKIKLQDEQFLGT